MRSKLKRAVHLYKNKGAKVFSRRVVSYSRKQIRNITKGNTKISAERKQLMEEYSLVSNKIFQITEQDIVKSNESISSHDLENIKTANWFVPYFDHLSFGGIYTIFRFIEKFSTEGVKNRIIIYDNPSVNVSDLETEITKQFKKLKNYELIIFDNNAQSVDELPECDIAICTFWVSAYLLLKFNKTKKKYYFIQDYEPFFYVAGSTFALAESTYRFGFRGLVNTPGLLAAVNQRHGLEGISFIPAVDQGLYTPDFTKNNKKVRVFFYARPFNPRNAFNLGILTIQKLVEKYGKDIDIVTAGAEWDEAEYGLKGKITNLGLLKGLEDVAALYRGCDIGFVFMLSKHPSYQPFEFMASGMATVTNTNEDNLWMLRDKENCLLSEPSPASMSEKISLLIDNPQLRKKIARNGYDSLGYTWEQQTDMIWNDIQKN